MSVSMKLSQISHQQGLSRKSTLLTLLWMEGGVGGFAEESWLLAADMLQSEGPLTVQKGQCLWEGWISCFSFYS